MEDIDIVIFDNEELMRTLVESYIKDLTFSCKLLCYNDFNRNVLSENDKTKFIFVNIQNSNNENLERIASYSNNTALKFIAVSYEKSANLQVKAFRAGAKDFLIKPLIKDDFINSVNYLYNKYVSPINATIAKVYAAVSFQKGDGKSLFLINLAKEIADYSKDKVLFIDFNNSQDNISFLLNVNIAHNTDYYINNINEDNADSLLSDISKYKDSSLYIMANGVSKNKSAYLKYDKLFSAIDILKHHYKFIIIDKSQEEKNISNETFINIADEIFFIVLPSTNSFGKIKNLLDNDYKDKNVKIIINQSIVGDESKIEQIQALSGCEIFGKIPQNYSVVNTAINNNITYKEASKCSDIVSAYIELAKSLVNRVKI